MAEMRNCREYYFETLKGTFQVVDLGLSERIIWISFKSNSV